MKRICPFCKSVLNKNSSFFCSSCGNVLPNDIQQKEPRLGNVREMNETAGGLEFLSNSFKSVGKKIFSMVDMKMLLVGISIGVLITICFYLLVRFTLPTFTDFNIDIDDDSEDGSIVIAPTKPSNIIAMDINLSSGVFGQFKVTEYVPYDADLYMEFNDFSSFEPYFNFLGGEVLTLSESIKGKVEPFYSVFLLTRDGNKYWTFIFFPTDEDLNAGSYSGLTSEKIGDAVVISTNEVVIEEVNAVKVGNQKSLALNSEYVITKNNIPVEGKVLITTFNEDGKTEIENLLAKTTSDDIKLIIEKYKEINSNYLVIK